MIRVAVLGSGMAGFGAAYRLAAEGIRPAIFDQNPYHGGHAASFRHPGGFTFDDGPHVSFTRVERLQRLFADAAGGEVETIRAAVNNYWRGFWIKHPAQCNLHGLPTDLVVDVLRDMIRARYEPERAVRTYEDWLRASFGNAFASTFPMEYGLKYHTTPADNMTTDWLGPRLYRPELDEVLRGALSSETPDVHYVNRFRYPSRGGFVTFLDGILRQPDLRLNHRLIRLDAPARLLRFANGTIEPYDAVISSIPLPALVPLIAGVPDDVREATERLACTSCVVVNVGVDRADISRAHWTYFYDRDIVFTRVSFPHMLSAANVPPGAGSIQAEVYYSAKYRPLDRPPDAFVDPVIADLRRCGLLREEDRILFSNASLIRFANVIFDLDRRPALETVHGFLEDIGVHVCGRYGDWAYHWTDESFTSGERAAGRALDALRPAVSRCVVAAPPSGPAQGT